MSHLPNTKPTIEQDFTKIYNQYSNQMRKQLYYRFGDFEKAEDAVQETFIKLWNNRSQVSYDKVKGYLFVVANNTFLNSIRNVSKFDRSADVESGMTFSSNQSPDYIIEEKEYWAKIKAVLASLPPKQNKVFVMNRLEGKTYKKIAEELEISVKTVEKRMQAALCIVRLVLQSDLRSYK